MSGQSRRTQSLVGVIASMAVVNLVYGITFPLLALVLDHQGVSRTLIGLSTVSQALAILAIAPLAPRLLARYQPARLMQGAAVLLAVLFLFAGWYPNVYFWFPLRFVIGALTALLWIASEALINELAEERWRGRVIGLYSSIGAAGFALGPLLLIATGSSGMLPFYSTSAMILLAALPLLLVQLQVKEPLQDRPRGVFAVFLLAPVIMLANVVYAAVAESMITFFPLYGLGMGLPEHFALGLMTVMGLGSMILILPLGWLADQVNRMGMLVVCLLLSMAGLLLLPLAIQMPGWAAGLFAFVFGGVEGMIYALGVMLVGQQFKGPMLASATTAFTACWGVGTVLGPMLAGVSMDWFGPQALLLTLFVFLLLYLPLPLRAWLRQRH